jgi:hypothetical protein
MAIEDRDLARRRKLAVTDLEYIHVEADLLNERCFNQRQFQPHTFMAAVVLPAGRDSAGG